MTKKTMLQPPASLQPQPSTEPQFYSTSTVCGRREAHHTVISYRRDLSGDDKDLLTIAIGEHNGEDSTTLRIRGNWEMAEMPGHLRWLADLIAEDGEYKGPAFKEFVTRENKSFSR